MMPPIKACVLLKEKKWVFNITLVTVLTLK